MHSEQPALFFLIKEEWGGQGRERARDNVTDRQTGRQAGRQTDRQAGRQNLQRKMEFPH